MFKFYLTILIGFIITLNLSAQTTLVSINCFGDNNEQLTSFTLRIKGSKNTFLADAENKVQVNLNSGDVFTISHIGYETLTATYNGGSQLNLILKSLNEKLENVIVLGTRNSVRSKTISAVPVDVFDIKSLAKILPQTSINDILNNVAPSFTATSQQISDGSDHIDPATVRGLGTDQTLVLVNGKRRYTTALVNVNGTVGRGSVGTDLNAIALNSIERIELLRDGAAAQYGSDAVAGVINITLKRVLNQGSASIGLGANATSFQALTQNTLGDIYRGIPAKYVDQNVVDGYKFGANVNYGWALGKKGSFIDFAFNFEQREPTSRSGERTGDLDGRIGGDSASNALLKNLGITRDAFKIRAGQSRLTNLQLVVNGEIKFNPSSSAILYYNAILASRDGNSAGFYRLPYQATNIPAIYPKGFLPEINSKINDFGVTFGFKGKSKSGWNYDFSNVLGGNTFEFIISNTLNVSAWYADANSGAAKQTTFKAGSLGFYQNTSNIDISKNFREIFNLAFGFESRIESYEQIAGEESSWKNYANINGTVQSYTLADGKIGRPAGGSQVFAGFLPDNALQRGRFSQAAYLDLEVNPTKEWFLNGALRFENYSDFGTNLSYKLATRVKLSDVVTLRASASTGFRAPSLQQIYLAKTTSLIQPNGSLVLAATLPNNSAAATALGIPTLRPELSNSISSGITLKKNSFSLTLDYFITNVTDRIILTDNFSGSATGSSQDMIIYQALLLNNATNANFMANALDMQVRGFDFNTNYKFLFSRDHSLRLELATSITIREQIGNVKASDLLKGREYIYLSPFNANLVFNANPQSKGFYSMDYRWKKLNIYGKLGYFGAVTHIDVFSVPAATATQFGSAGWFYKQLLDPKYVVDLSVGYDITKMFRVSLAVNNIFDIYSDLIDASKGSFFQVDTKVGSSTYNKIIREYSARLTGVTNSNSVNTTNQLNYSRRVSQIGLNGRFVYLTFAVNF